MINFVIENDWKWTHCRLPIKRCEKKGKKVEEEYFYQVINSEDTGLVNESKIKVNLDKPFPFEPQTGFVWHKSWNLPEITVAINEE